MKAAEGNKGLTAAPRKDAQLILRISQSQIQSQ
jgi:hypothetical protein